MLAILVAANSVPARGDLPVASAWVWRLVRFVLSFRLRLLPAHRRFRLRCGQPLSRPGQLSELGVFSAVPDADPRHGCYHPMADGGLRHGADNAGAGVAGLCGRPFISSAAGGIPVRFCGCWCCWPRLMDFSSRCHTRKCFLLPSRFPYCWRVPPAGRCWQPVWRH